VKFRIVARFGAIRTSSNETRRSAEIMGEEKSAGNVLRVLKGEQ
jgi:hypothetical protein